MNAVFVLDGRALNTKLQDGFLGDMEGAAFAAMARKGSQMLRDAILRAKGYPVPQPVRIAPVAPPPAPVFKARAAKRGCPKGRRKIHRSSPKVEQIKALIAAQFDMSIDDLGKRGTKFERAHPRQIAMYIARKATSVSYPGIARQFGGFDHTTVIHAVRAVEKRVANGDGRTIDAIRAVHKVIGA